MKNFLQKIHIPRETLACIPVAIGFLLLIFAMLTARFSRSFLPGTSIGNISLSACTPETATYKVYNHCQENTVTLLDQYGEEITSLPLSSFFDFEDIKNQFTAYLEQQQRATNLFSWVSQRGTSLSISYFNALTMDSTAETLRQALYGKDAYSAPISAELLYDEEQGYVLKEADTGNAFALGSCTKYVYSALTAYENGRIQNYRISVPGGRIYPKITNEDTTLNNSQKALESYLSNSISIDFLYDDQVYTLTRQDIVKLSDIEIDKTVATFTPNPEKVTAFVNDLVDTYGTEGLDAKYYYCKQTRDEITPFDSDQGWIINRDLLAEQLQAALTDCTECVLTPSYDRTRSLQNIYGCWNCLIEISIDNQYVWMYVNDELIVETPVVTGDIATGTITRRGFFQINAMTSDVYLSGPTWYDHVDYWMPFDEGIGMHDSSWRDEYGGDIYLTDGSHGCVNTPLEAMAKIYENAWWYMPVIVY